MDALLTKSKAGVKVDPHGKDQSRPKISGSKALLQSLVAEDVNILFGYPGGAIMPVYDALYDFSDQLTHILVRHEQGVEHGRRI